MKWKDTEFERQVRSESLNPLSSRRCKQPSATAAELECRELSSTEQPRSRQTPPGSADSLLSHVEITGDFDFKDHNDGNHFLACEIASRVAARTYLERMKQGSAASKVQLEAQHAEGQHSGFQHRALLQSKLLEPAVVKSVHTYRRNFPFFFFLSFLFFFAPLANFLSAFTQQLLPLRVS